MGEELSYYSAMARLPVFLTSRFLQNYHGAGRSSLFGWSSTSRQWMSSDDSTTVEQDKREAQLLEDEDTIYEDDIKHKILDAALNHVQQSGWTKETLAIGAESLGYPGITHGLFPQGGVELVHHFYRQSNLRLAAELEQEGQEEMQRDPSKRRKNAQFLRDYRKKITDECGLRRHWPMGPSARFDGSAAQYTHVA